MQVHDHLIQGSDDWLAYRVNHDNASEIAAVLGLSKTTTRTELLNIKHTGLGKEFSAWVQRNVLDYGHEVEAKVRPLIEAMIGEDLYTVTCSDGRLSASLDGLNMSEEIAFECKQWNAEIASQVAAGVMPEQHMPQCQQILLVTGAKELIFAVGDGTSEKLLTLKVYPDPDWFERIRGGWAQFHIDLAAHFPTEKTVAPVGAAITALPAVSVQVTGSISVKDNFKAFEVALTDFIEHRLIRKPETDQDFADLDTQIKALKGAELALDALEAQMLSQVEAVDMAKRTKDMLLKMARDNRLMAEKLLAARKDQIKVEQVQRGQKALAEHIAALNARLGKPYMPAVTTDFAAAIKGLRTVDSLKNAIDTLLASVKILSSATADRIQANLATLVELGSEHKFLFGDTSTIVLKACDDLTALVKTRIAEHAATELAKEAATRESIRVEEQAKAEATARATVLAEQAAAAAQKVVDDAAAKAALHKEANDAGAAAMQGLEVARQEDALPLPLIDALEGVASSLIADLAVTHAVESSKPTANVVPMVRPSVVAPAIAPSTPPSMKLGDLNAMLSPITLTADGLEALGFPVAAMVKGAKLYHASDLTRICGALHDLIDRVQAKQAA